MVRLLRSLRNRTWAKTRQPELNETAEGDQSSPQPGYVKWGGGFNYFSGVQSVMIELNDMQKSHKPKRS